jgi:hypothetical protein
MELRTESWYTLVISPMPGKSLHKTGMGLNFWAVTFLIFWMVDQKNYMSEDKIYTLYGIFQIEKIKLLKIQYSE